MQEGQKALCIQFPIQLADAMTIHKIQGGTVPIPRTLTSHFGGIFGDAQAHTVLGRVKRLEQLYLLDDLFEDKIYASRKALVALKELEDKAINANVIGKRCDQIKIAFLNVQNFKHHIEDVKKHHLLHDQNLFVLSETWLSDVQTCYENNQF